MQRASGGPLNILYICTSIYRCFEMQINLEMTNMNKIQTTEETNLLDYNEEKKNVLLSIDEHGILYWFNALSNFDFIQKV